MDELLYNHTFYCGYPPEILKILFRNSKGNEFEVLKNKGYRSLEYRESLEEFKEHHPDVAPEYIPECLQKNDAHFIPSCLDSWSHPFLDNLIVDWLGKYVNEKIIIPKNERKLYDPFPDDILFESDWISYRYKPIIKKEEKKGYLYVDFSYSTEKLDKEFDRSFDGKQYTDRNRFWTPVVCPMIDIDENITHNKGEKYVFHPYIRIGKTESGHYFSDDYYNKRYYFKVYNNEKKGKYITIPIYVYRLVAETYLDNPNPRKYSQVHHILNNGYNNSVFNLMWVTDEQHRWIEER